MSLTCLNCGTENERVTLIPAWVEYRVGSVSSEESFFFCPDCKADDDIDPIEVWAEVAAVTNVSRSAKIIQ